MKPFTYFENKMLLRIIVNCLLLLFAFQGIVLLNRVSDSQQYWVVVFIGLAFFLLGLLNLERRIIFLLLLPLVMSGVADLVNHTNLFPLTLYITLVTAVPATGIGLLIRYIGTYPRVEGES